MTSTMPESEMRVVYREVFVSRSRPLTFAECAKLECDPRRNRFWNRQGFADIEPLCSFVPRILGIPRTLTGNA